jgi:hypothetical protein
MTRHVMLAFAAVGLVLVVLGVAFIHYPQQTFRARHLLTVRERSLTPLGEFFERATGVFLLAGGALVVSLAVLPDPLDSTVGAIGFLGIIAGSAVLGAIRRRRA